MEFTARAIADFLKGEIQGNPDAVVYNVSKIEEGKPGTLAFLANPKYAKYLYTTEASIVLVNKDLNLEKEVNTTLIRVENAYESFASLLHLYEQSKPKKTGVSAKSHISESAKVGENAYIGEFTVLEDNVTTGKNVRIYPNVYLGPNVTVGDNTVIYPGVKIYEECKIGSNCIIHAGVVIGSDGFGFAPQEGSDYKKIPQIGNVIIEDNVEIGSNCSIDRATMGSTIIRKGAKIDNLVQIAHNVEIGENTVVVAQVGIAGSTKIGRDCMIAGQVGIVGHLNIGNGVKIAAQSGVSSNVPDNKILLGSPANDIGQARKSIAVYRNLPQLRNKIIDLEKELASLKEKINEQ